MLMITSFNAQLMAEYGLRMAQEFSEKSDGSVQLKVIFEGDSVPDFGLPNVEFIRFNHSGHNDFQRKFGRIQEAHGIKITQLPNHQIHVYFDFKYDAVRFSFKIFAILQALSVFKPQKYFAWLDADMRCIKEFGKLDLIPYFPCDGQLMSYLGRNNFPPTGAYSECGFLGFNIQHPETMAYLNRMAEIYLNGEIFAHEQWHDSWLWDQTRAEFEKKRVEFKNISGPAAEMDHPFINCGLGQFFDHLKGPVRKQRGYSFAEDYKLNPPRI